MLESSNFKTAVLLLLIRDLHCCLTLSETVHEQDGCLHGEHGEGVEDVPWVSHLCRVLERGQHLRRPEAAALLGLRHIPPHGPPHSSGHIPHICHPHHKNKIGINMYTAEGRDAMLCIHCSPQSKRG